MNGAVRTVVCLLGCLLGAALIIVAIPAPHGVEPVTVSYRADLARLTAAAPYPAVAPAGLPGSWQPVSSALAHSVGTVSWHLGFMTPGGSLASVEESNEAAAGFVRRMTNNGTALPPARLAGRVWQRSVTPARGQRSMYFSVTGAAGFTVVVTGNAAWADLTRLAASLRPVAG
jgi:hypothetical protein